MNGKEKCKILKEIRTDIAKANNIPLEIPECTHKGDCKGTCPRCEAEVKYLENKLAERRKRGLKIAVAGISASLVAFNATSCDILDEIVDRVGIQQTLEGDMRVEYDGVIPESDTTENSKNGIIESTEFPGEVVTDALEGDIVDIQGDLAFTDTEELIAGALPLDTDCEDEQ